MTRALPSKCNYVMLADLPEDDPLRTTPLHLIGAEYFHVKDPTVWRPVTPDKFWGFTYNDLDGPWTAFSRWRAPKASGANSTCAASL